LAASRRILPPRFEKYFIVHSPSTWARMMSPLCGSLPFSTITRSPGMIPAPAMESPLTLRRKEDSGLVIRYSSREMRSLSSSSAGDGKPAWISPTRGSGKAGRRGRRKPFESFS